MTKDLTSGPITKSLLLFALPMIAGNLLQQFYNIADTMIVGRFLGKNALAAVGSSFTLMTFLTSIILGLAMGSGVLFSMKFGEKDEEALRRESSSSFFIVLITSIILTIAAYALLDFLKDLMNIPDEVWPEMRDYLIVIFSGIIGIFFYNWFSSFLRALGNSTIPLLFLAISTILNIGLDLYFVLALKRGVRGAAEATVISEYISGMGVAIYTLIVSKESRFSINYVDKKTICEVTNFSFLTCLQQSVMNLGILMVQGRVNSFGPVVMAAFSTGVKIDAFAYMPLQDYGNAFSTFTAQNYGAEKKDRIQKGMSVASIPSLIFSLIIPLLVFILSPSLMTIFVGVEELEIISVGTGYLRVEGAFYALIGFLFLFYGLYRGVGKPGMSFILTIISLGSRVLLSYTISGIPYIGVYGIWWSVPIGWLLADIVGALYYIKNRPPLMIENTKRRKESKKWQKGLERVK